MPGAKWYLKKRLDRRRSGSRGLNILSIDAGGARGLSSLIILHEIMKRIQKAEGLLEVPDPEEYFDLMGGTGTGGIIVAMVGRLRMPTEVAIKRYVKLAEVFSEKKVLGSGASVFKASKLEAALKEFIQEATGNTDEPMMIDQSDVEMCKTMIFASSEYNLNAGIPCIFRSYPVLANQMPNCALWGVLRATTAHPELFKSIEIGESHLRESFVDGSLSCSNPLWHVLEEVEQLFPGREVASIISIGAGQARTIQIPKPSPFQRILPINAIIAMKEIAADSERVAHRMAKRFQGTKDLYFRFNVDQGMQGVGISEWERLPEVNAHTRGYMQHVECDRSLDLAANVMKEGKGVVSAAEINEQVSVNAAKQPTMTRFYPMPTPVFVGCETVLEQIRICLVDHIDSDRRVFVLHGLGGTGKTQIASRFIEITRSEWSEVVYVDASSRDAIVSSLQSHLASGGSGVANNRIIHQIPWPACGKFLLVFDGADDPALRLTEFFPGSPRCNILITSRHRDLVLLARGPRSDHHISGMSPEESQELLLKTARVQYEELHDTDREAAAALVQDFDYLPLAMVHAGAYIWKSALSIAQFRDLYLSQKRTILEEYGKMPIKIDGYEHTVHTTWMMSYERLSDSAKRLLWLFSLLHPNDIPGDIFRRAKALLAKHTAPLPPIPDELETRKLADDCLDMWSDAEGHWSQPAFLATISELLSLSLIRYDRANQTYSLHALVHTWAGTVVPDKAAALACMTFLLGVSAGQDSSLEDIVFRRRLVLHVDAILAQAPNTTPNIAAQIAQICLDNFRLIQAELLVNQVGNAIRPALGDKHPETLKNMSMLATIYAHQGRWKDAEILRIQVLASRQEILGPGCQETLDSLYDLAETYSEQGRFQESEELAATTLQGIQQTLGEDHPSCFRARALLSDVLRKQNKINPGDETLRRLLIPYPGAYGRGGLPNPTPAEDLAFTYAQRGQLNFIMKVVFHEMVLRDHHFGKNHPEALKFVGWIAAVEHNHGELRRAESMWERVVNGLKDRLGEEHPSTLSSMGWLAESYHARKKLEEAERLQQRVVELRTKVLGGEHSDTLTSANSLVTVYQSQGRFREAEGLQIWVAGCRERVLGKEHPYTLASRNNLAKIYRSQGRLTEAENLGAEVVDICRRVLGEEQVGTLTSMSNLALTYRDQGRLDVSEELQARVVNTHKRLLGKEHPDT
ncbi:hypothetical protein FRC06_011684, partial [Ceratobasidium sp. 370]